MEKAEDGTQAPNAKGPRNTPNASLASSSSASIRSIPQPTSAVKPGEAAAQRSGPMSREALAEQLPTGESEAVFKLDTLSTAAQSVKEYRMVGQNIPEEIKAYVEKQGVELATYARNYDTKVLELVDIEKEGASSSAPREREASLTHKYPSAPSVIRVADLLELVKGDARKYIPKTATRWPTPSTPPWWTTSRISPGKR